jgi:hypothetical protein
MDGYIQRMTPRCGLAVLQTENIKQMFHIACASKSQPLRKGLALSRWWIERACNATRFSPLAGVLRMILHGTCVGQQPGVGEEQQFSEDCLPLDEHFEQSGAVEYRSRLLTTAHTNASLTRQFPGALREAQIGYHLNSRETR